MPCLPAPSWQSVVPDPRATVRRLAEERRLSLAELSRRLDRNPAWLHQYLDRGSPRVLPEGDRYVLARLFGVGEAELGGREMWRADARPTS